MAARWMEQKKKKMRRAYLKSRKSGEFNPIVSPLLHGSTKTHATKAVPKTLFKIPNADQPTSDRSEFLSVKLVDMPAFSISMFFSGQQFFFVEEDLFFNTIKRSEIYYSRSIAMKYFEANKISWASVEGNLATTQENNHAVLLGSVLRIHI